MITLLFALTLAASAEEIPKGKLVEKVVCQAEPAQSYALYLPSNYDPLRKWPVLYCFDPMARGRVPVERFQEGAEKYGYIVVGSNNSRNGPWDPSIAAAQAMWADTHARFSIDERRAYGTGYSGGARLASRIGLAGTFAGVIACGAGLPAGPLPKTVPFVFFGAVGTDDFNYGELRQLDQDLDGIGAVHRVAVFSGRHDWAPVALSTEALGWLELQAMRAGTRAKDEAMIRALYEARLAAVQPLPAAESYPELKSLAADFQGLAATAEIEKKAAALAGSREVRDWVKKEHEQNVSQTEMTGSLMDLAERGMIGELRGAVSDLRRKADGSQDSAERRLARRVLDQAFIQGSEVARDQLEKKEYGHAAAMLETMAVIRPERAQTFYGLARARALGGDKKKALAALKQAVAGGYKDAARVEQDEAFAKLRDDAAFQALVAAMKK